MSKFQPLDAYRTQTPYELLPFKFDRFNAAEYLLTNLVGEHLLLPAEDLPG